MDPTSGTTPADPTTTLLTTYNELNSASVDELSEVPSPLEFMRYVARNRPFVVRGGANDWEATRTWDVGTLKTLMEGQSVNVAVTPLGNADSPVLTPEGKLVLVKPHEEQQDFSTFIDYVATQELTNNTTSEVRYAQTQNDNLRNEYSTLFTHVTRDIPWARIALTQPPEAINLWIGNSRSVTALHKDNYENIYVQIIGEKHFVLLPPLAFAVVGEKLMGNATYVRDGDELVVRQDEDGSAVPFATWDPDKVVVDGQKGRYEGLLESVRVTLGTGDILYLPALWYHKVSQSCSDEGICCAVNYWHDMEFGGSFYPLCEFARDVAKASLGRVD